jgi:hypothetical protein
MKNNQIIYIILIIVIIILLGIILYFGITQHKCTIENKNNYEQNNNQSKEDYENNKEVIISTINYPRADIQRDPKTLNSLDRIYNPLRYPYKSDYYYDQRWYPNLQLPFQVIGCGARNTPCLGGTEVPIYNPPVTIDVSDRNIAPINISTRGPLGQPQQLGVLYKVYGNENDVLPLFGRRRYPNDSKFDYYTMTGQFGTKVPIVTKNRNNELGTNDVVFIKGSSSPYRVTVYESDFAQYIPYV